MAQKFWGAEVDCKETATMRPGRPFRLTTVTLAVGVKVIEERTTLQILAHNDDDDDSSVPTPTTVAHLKVGVIENLKTEVLLDHSRDYTFIVLGPNPIHISGIFIDSEDEDSDAKTTTFKKRPASHTDSHPAKNPTKKIKKNPTKTKGLEVIAEVKESVDSDDYVATPKKKTGLAGGRGNTRRR